MKRITTLSICANNILNRRFRSVCIALLIAMTTFLITGGTLLGFGLRNGVASVTARLGADAIIVPQAAGSSYEGALLSGSPATFYISKDAAGRIMRTDGIERVTTQLYISSFDSSHCAALVQIIGYEPASDFVITPWLKNTDITEPGYGEAVIGGNLTQLDIGDSLLLFATKLKVVGILDKTGMGFDNSVFVNMDTAVMLLGEYEKYADAIPFPDGLSANGVVSTILIDVKRGVDMTDFKKAINLRFRDEHIRVVTAQEFITSTAANLGLAGGILTVLVVTFWLFAVFVLAIIFTIALNERRREFGILRAIGATRRKLIAIVITESALLCGAGAIVGIGAVCLIVFPYNELIKRLLRTVYMIPSGGVIVAIMAVCFALGAITGPLASIVAAARIGKSGVFVNMQEGL